MCHVELGGVDEGEKAGIVNLILDTLNSATVQGREDRRRVRQCR